jgi:hypothetical protein
MQRSLTLNFTEIGLYITQIVYDVTYNRLCCESIWLKTGTARQFSAKISHVVEFKNSVQGLGAHTRSQTKRET